MSIRVCFAILISAKAACKGEGDHLSLASSAVLILVEPWQNKRIQVALCAIYRGDGSEFATTLPELPELYDTMCSNRQNRPAETAVKRLNRYQ